MSETDKARADRLERELEKVQHSVARKRKEIRQLTKQLAEWKQDNRPLVRLKKEVEGLKSNMARIKFNGKKARAERDALYLAVKEEVERHRNCDSKAITAEQLHEEDADRLQAILDKAGEKREVPDYGKLADEVRQLLDFRRGIGPKEAGGFYLPDTAEVRRQLDKIATLFSSEQKGGGS